MADSAEEYGAPTWPVLAGQASVTGAGAMEIPQLLMAVPAGVPVESDYLDGVREVPGYSRRATDTPVELFKISPGGSEPAVMEKV